MADPRNRCHDRPEPDDLRRARLPQLDYHAATRHLDPNRLRRPWLDHVSGFDQEERRVAAALDQGAGHTLQRHSPFGDRDVHRRRVERMEDPAQLDGALRERGIDGVTGKAHYCSDIQTRFTDMKALTTAFTRSLNNPRIRETLERGYNPESNFPRVSLPIEQLLGTRGHLYCEGYQLAGNIVEAKADRKAWLQERAGWLRQHGNLDGFTAQPPASERIASFEGGMIEFRFRPTDTKDGYQVHTFFPRPAEPDEDRS